MTDCLYTLAGMAPPTNYDYEEEEECMDEEKPENQNPESADQSQSQEEVIVASVEEIMAAFLQSEPRYENLYRRLAQ